MDGLLSGAEVAFRIPSGAELPAVGLSAGGTGADLRLLIEVDAEHWPTVDLVELFHLGLMVRGPGGVSGDGPVQIELRPAPAIVDRLADVTLPDDLAGLDEDDPLLSVMNWYATEVTEEVELPPALSDTGELRQGFTTSWREEVPPTAATGSV